MLDTVKIHVVAADEGEAIDVLGLPMVVKCDGSHLPLFLAEHELPPGAGTPAHTHDHDDEMFYMLAGELTLEGREGETRIGPGACAQFPRGSFHGFRNDGPEAARFLVICNPGRQALEMFRHFDRAGRASGAALAPEAVGAICDQYGVRFG